jgi:hypothetical protein
MGILARALSPTFRHANPYLPSLGLYQITYCGLIVTEPSWTTFHRILEWGEKLFGPCMHC